MLKFTDAPDPSNIIWENINASFCSLLWRRLISLVLTLCLLIISKMKWKGKKWDSLYCDYILEEREWNLYCEIPSNWMRYFREYNWNNGGAGVQLNSEKGICGMLLQRLHISWYSKHTARIWNWRKNLPQMVCWKSLANCFSLSNCAFNSCNQLYYATGLCRSVTDFLDFLTSIGLSKFEKHRFLSSELGSCAIKIFISQFINTVVVFFPFEQNSGDHYSGD